MTNPPCEFVNVICLMVKVARGNPLEILVRDCQYALVATLIIQALPKNIHTKTKDGHSRLTATYLDILTTTLWTVGIL